MKIGLNIEVRVWVSVLELKKEPKCGATKKKLTENNFKKEKKS